MIFRASKLCIVLLSLLLLTACDKEAPPLKVDITEKASETDLDKSFHTGAYRFGFDLRSSPQEDSRQYQPLLDYLNKKTGFKFVLAFVRSDKPIADQFSSRAIDFAAAGAVSTIRAIHAGVAEPLVRGVSKEGRSTYRAAIVVPLNSDLTRLSSLRGKRLALGAESSTQGHLIPRLMLNDEQLKLKDLRSFTYAGSHLRCAELVMNGEVDACGMQDVMATQLAVDKKIRILQYSNEFPSSGIIASNHLPADVREQVKRALLEFSPEGQDAAGLYHWEKTEMPKGFVAAHADDYRELEAGMSALGF